MKTEGYREPQRCLEPVEWALARVATPHNTDSRTSSLASTKRSHFPSRLIGPRYWRCNREQPQSIPTKCSATSFRLFVKRIHQSWNIGFPAPRTVDPSSINIPNRLSSCNGHQVKNLSEIDQLRLLFRYFVHPCFNQLCSDIHKTTLW